MKQLFRKVTIGVDLLGSNVMNYVVGQKVYSGAIIEYIEEGEDGSCYIHIRKGDDILRWKKLNKNVAFTLEYNLYLD